MKGSKGIFCFNWKKQNVPFKPLVLKAGKHAIRVEYVNDIARAQLQVSRQGSGSKKTVIGKDSLSREP